MSLGSVLLETETIEVVVETFAPAFVSLSPLVVAQPALVEKHYLAAVNWSSGNDEPSTLSRLCR